MSINSLSFMDTNDMMNTEIYLSKRKVMSKIAGHVAECDYFGIATGNKVKNKLEAAQMTTARSENVDAPIINELAVCMECKLITYDPKTCIMKGEIVNVSVDESAMTDGKVDVSKVAPITFDPFNNAYHVIGEKVGDAWGSGKKFM